ncbi:MAG: hypothetical protein V2I43_14965 [Parvularcula sp.]|jgi:hypothetical protein|nr:hypothetical protein [Parvularcula sp.]
MSFVTAIEWTATATGVVAAIIVSLNLGITKTGWGFVIFTVSSVAWIGAALLEGEMALGVQNAVLFVINIIGIYRYLIHGKKRQQAAGSGGATATA